jgi:type IV pilus assembly protein PilC
MAVFTYRAIDQAGRLSTGRMPALNERELEARLRNTGLEVIASSPMSSRGMFSFGRAPRKELINFCFHMEQTLRGGVLLTDALADLVEGVTHQGFRDIVTVLLEAVRDGSPLSLAMGEFPNTFDEVFIGLIRAGEQSGQLPDTFAKLASNLKWLDELASQVKKMLTYPAFTIAVLLGVTAFMLTYLVPQLATFIKSMSGELPLQTRMLLALSDLTVRHWGKLLLAPIVIFVSVFAALRYGSEQLRMRVDRLKLRLPVIGAVIEKVILARFSSLFGMLYASGVPVMSSLEVCQSAAGNRWVAQGIGRVQHEITQGRGITEAFERVGLFPNLVLRMVRIGESTGEIDKALTNVSYFYDREVQETIARVQALIEPALTVSLGLLLGWLMMSVLGPIYDLLGKIKV